MALLFQGGEDGLEKMNVKKEPQKNLNELNSSLENLIISLKKNDEKTMEEIKKKNKNDGYSLYFGENDNGDYGIISQIKNKLHVDMIDFESHFKSKHADEDELIKKQKERDVVMKAEGRNDLLRKQLNQMQYQHLVHPTFLDGENCNNDNNRNNITFNKNYPRAFGGENFQRNLGQNLNQNSSNYDLKSRNNQEIKGTAKINNDDKNKCTDDERNSNIELNRREVTFTTEEISAELMKQENKITENNGNDNNDHNSEIEKSLEQHNQLLKKFQTGYLERIKELELLHSTAMQETTHTTDPGSGISPTLFDPESVLIEVRESGIMDSGSGILGPGSGIIDPGSVPQSLKPDSVRVRGENEKRNQFGLNSQSFNSQGDEGRNEFIDSLNMRNNYVRSQAPGSGQNNVQYENQSTERRDDFRGYHDGYVNNNNNDRNGRGNDDESGGNYVKNDYSKWFNGQLNNYNHTHNNTFSYNQNDKNIHANDYYNSHNNSNNNYYPSNKYTSHHQNSNYENRNRSRIDNYSNNKNEESRTDVRHHPYAQNSYVRSLCPDLVHTNILSVSKGDC